jgi:hypothetical protein
MDEKIRIIKSQKKTSRLERVLGRLLDSKYYYLGDPWRGNDKVRGFFVPIILLEVQQRGYQMAEECSHKIRILDSGKIRGMDVANPDSSAVFMRGGTVTKGGTQTRTISYGIIIEPQTNLTPVEVKCIFETHGIRRGARSHIDDLCYLRSSLQHRLYQSQRSIWEGIRKSRMDMLCCSDKLVKRGFHHSQNDDYLGTINEFRKKILADIKKAPNIKNQVGILVFRKKMLRGLELFDHPDSWKAVHDKVLESHVIELMPRTIEKKQVEDPYLSENEISSHLSDYFHSIHQEGHRVGTDKILMKGKTWSTHLLSNGKLVEYTILNDDIIHVLSVVKNGI